MVDNNTVMKSGKCIECGANEIDGLSCYEMFQFPLVWEHNDPNLYDLHFWLVSCYMIQHPSNYTKGGYNLMINLFKSAYDNKWATGYILRKNRELVSNVAKITNPLPSHKRKRVFRRWSMTIESIYIGGENNAINNINIWKETIRKDLKIYI
ncbi:hypothetical protein H1W83_29200 (plasmid) [Priestia megaterium]|jgi:Family of unknown function (DUF5946)|uniref:DUF5946 family protein n=1 Tax=Priestia megaterium TaxID=1404 RepID=UPI001EDC0312|nr:DUF5946 family protein [Priestia megaterium]UKJ83747.1 hypothetical protein H1W83_29200 [Priestia megaterium]